MKTPNFIVRIPEPCHEDWNKMEPDAKGKFCNSCSKSVFDFSNKTDIEIKDILLEYKDQKVCGHFKKSQVNRPLNISINLKDLPKNISMTKAFAIALFLVFGTFLFSCTDEHGQKVNQIEIVGSKPEERIMMGDVSFVPPADYTNTIETISGDTMIEPLEATYIMNEEHVDGGISFIEIPDEMIVPVKEDTVSKEESPTEHFVLGQMVSPYIDKTGSDQTSAMDTVNLEEITIVDYLEPLVDPETMSGRTSATTGLVSICSFPADSSTIQTNVTQKNNEFIVFPNPSNGEFTIKYLVSKRTNVLLEVYDLKGILIRTIVDVADQYEGKYQIPVNLSELPNGIYLISLIKGDKKSVERLVIER
ncbi:MAG: T9SS type A sorting domain-containing protein [Bacteroidota bacterium]